MLDNLVLSANIKKYRLLNKMTQTELSEKIYVSCQAVSKWERGLMVPELDKVCLIADVFNISVDELLGSEKEKIDFYIGIDGGGSKTEFVLFDSKGEIHDRITLGGCNPNSIGIENSLKILLEGINSVSQSKRVKGIYIGASGFKTIGKEKIKKELIKNYPYSKIECNTDIVNVISSARIKEDCIAAICGTGTVVYTSIGNNLKSYTGWGYLLDEGGSGFHIGRDGIAASLAANENLGQDTLIRKYIEEKLNSSVSDNIKTFYEKGQAFIASFASCVFKAYEAKDDIAIRILNNNAERTAFVINKVKKDNPKINKVILSGSIFTKDDYYFNLVKDRLSKNIEIIRVKLPQVFGACLLCSEMCSLDTDKIYDEFLKIEE